MIVVDSSVWIGSLRGRESPQTLTLRRLLRDKRVLVGDLVLCEVLKGARSDAEAMAFEALLHEHTIVTMIDATLAAAAGYHYRLLRAQGVTVYKTVDLLIGTFCILRRHTLLHADHDFDAMERYLGLRVVPATWAVHESRHAADVRASSV